MPICTYLIIGITVLISFLSFRNENLITRLQFNAPRIINNKEYYRLVSHAFVHAGWAHLFVNMLVLYFFGRNVEAYLKYLFDYKAEVFYLLLYFGSIIFSNAWALIKHRNNYYYNAVGASGAVSAILFAFIFFDPWQPLYLMGIIRIPGILFALGYLFYSYLMSKKQQDNIAHDAHFLGALFGFFFPLLLKPALFSVFLDKLFRIM
jgi:membrane associated rhomboid family serine protease